MDDAQELSKLDALFPAMLGEMNGCVTAQNAPLNQTQRTDPQPENPSG